MDADHSTTTQSLILIGDPDPNGDIKFLLGPSRTPLRVSSQVISLASPVIRAMIGPSFLSKRPSYEDPPEVALPDDDPTAMRWIFFALHFHDVDDNVPASTLKHMAVVCDKYDFSTALRSWSEMWLRRSIPDESQGASSWDYIWLAIAFDNQELFNTVTRSFIWNMRATVEVESLDPASVDATGALLVPENLLDALTSLKEDLAGRLTAKIEEFIKPYLSFVSYSDCESQKCIHWERLSHFFVELDRVGAWPLHSQMTKEGLAIVTARLRTYANHVTTSNTACSCLQRVDFKEMIGEAVDDVEREPRQLCLNCFKSGRVSVRQGNCQAGSRRECKLRKSSGDEVAVAT